MFKKNILIILFVLFIPFILILVLIFNPIFMDNYYNNLSFGEIPSKMFTIKDYEYLIIEEINKESPKIYDISLENYNIYPYTIIWKDTLSKIAYKFNLSKDEIAALVYINKIKNKDLIIAGEILLIPKKKK